MSMFHKSYHSPGTPPGTLVSPKSKITTKPVVTLIEVSAGELVELDEPSPGTIKEKLRSETYTWLSISGIPDAEWIRQLGNLIELHPLVLEDILNGGQRPKVEPYGDQVFQVINVPMIEGDEIKIESLYIIRHKLFLVSFYSGEAEFFGPLIKRFRTK